MCNCKWLVRDNCIYPKASGKKGNGECRYSYETNLQIKCDSYKKKDEDDESGGYYDHYDNYDPFPFWLFPII